MAKEENEKLPFFGGCRQKDAKAEDEVFKTRASNKRGERSEKIPTAQIAPATTHT